MWPPLAERDDSTELLLDWVARLDWSELMLPCKEFSAGAKVCGGPRCVLWLGKPEAGLGASPGNDEA